MGLPRQAHPRLSAPRRHREGLEALAPNEEIGVYCSNPDCVASVAAFRMLTENGYGNVRRYAGGLEDCEGAGYPLEGEMAW